MFKGIFSARRVTKADVILSVAAALVAVIKANDTIRDYRKQSEETEEIE